MALYDGNSFLSNARFPFYIERRKIRENRTTRPVNSCDREQVNTIVRYVEQHFNQPLTLTELCRACGMSVSSFSEKFKSVTGRSLMEYKQSIQVRQACDLLSSPGKKVVDVAYQVGFNDVSFFNKIFKKHTGMTPRQFRLQSRTDKYGT